MVHRFLTLVRRERPGSPAPEGPLRALAGRAFRLTAAGAGVVWSGLGTLFYPPVCLGCGQRLADARSILCLSCLNAADRADLYEVGLRLERLPEARQALDFAFSLWLFDKGGLLQDVHHALKYGNRPLYGRILGDVLGHSLLEVRSQAQMPTIIVPIPLHRSRLYERGYNQSEMLAEGVATAIGVPVAASVLRRVRSTPSQTRLSREKRWANLDGAFEVTDAGTVSGRRILLIDDVLTTGSTAGAAAQALKSAGAAAVDLATLALARQ